MEFFKKRKQLLIEQLFEYSELGYIKKVYNIVKKNRKLVDITDEYGFTPLMLAAIKDRNETAGVLMDYGANIEARSGAMANNSKFYKSIKENNDPLQCKIGLCNKTPLMLAAIFGPKDALAELSSVADLDAKDHNGSTALMCAAAFAQTNCVKILIIAGADAKIKDLSGMTAIDYAGSNREIINLISGKISIKEIQNSMLQNNIKKKPYSLEEIKQIKRNIEEIKEALTEALTSQEQKEKNCLSKYSFIVLSTDSEIKTSLMRVLKTASVNVKSADNIDAAIIELEKCKYDTIIVDVQFEKRIITIKELKLVQPGIEIILLASPFECLSMDLRPYYYFGVSYYKMRCFNSDEEIIEYFRLVTDNIRLKKENKERQLLRDNNKKKIISKDFRESVRDMKYDLLSCNLSVIREEFLDSGKYTPYESLFNNRVDEMDKLIKEEEIESAKYLIEKLLDYNYIYLRYHFQAISVYSKMSLESKVNYHKEFITQSINAILMTGDGKSFETAYKVLYVFEEYIILDHMGFRSKMQALANNMGYSYDVHLCECDVTQKPVEIYFSLEYFRKGVYFLKEDGSTAINYSEPGSELYKKICESSGDKIKENNQKTDKEAATASGSTPGDTTVIQGITFVAIPGGTFQMGSTMFSNEQPVHQVTVSTFQMSAKEITNSQYAAYLNTALAAGEITATTSGVTGAKGDYSGQMYIELSGSFNFNNRCWISYNGTSFSVAAGKENRPVVYVTWYGSKAFALKYGFDLPREGEWEYASSGGKGYEYGTDDGTISSSKANYNSNVGYPKDVGSCPANPFGLYDLAGNVWEWCNDWYGNYSSENANDPQGPSSGSNRASRGGSWASPDFCCQSADRGDGAPGRGGAGSGFRVVRR